MAQTGGAPGGLRGAVLVALFAALTAVGALVRIPLPTGVPFTLQVPAVLLAGVALGPLRGAASQAAYLACGLLGLPVFASGGGPGYVLVPTFGFLVGFVPGAAVAGLVAGDVARSRGWRVFAAMSLGVAAIYLVGVPWLAWNLAAVQGAALPPGLLRRMALVLLPLDLLKAALLLPLVAMIRARGGLLPRGGPGPAFRRERGVVAESRGRTALVRLAGSAACAGCASAGGCRAAGGGEERLLEALDPLGSPVGAQVEVAVDARPARRAAARRWLLPAAGLLCGAGLAQLAAAALLPGEPAARAAGLGGIVGAAAGALLARSWRGGGPPRPAEIVSRLDAGPGARVDAGPARG